MKQDRKDNPVPEGYNSVSPYLTINDVRSEIEFLCEVFDAKPKESLRLPDGTVSHSEVIIGDSVVMMGKAREGESGMQSMLYVYVADCDATFQRALESGATAITEPADQFYGDRSAGFIDPQGIQWFVATRVEDLSPAEIQERMNKAQQG